MVLIENFRVLSCNHDKLDRYRGYKQTQVILIFQILFTCQCSISLPDAGVHVSIRISRLYLRVYVLCTHRRTDLRPLVWNVAVCTACCSNNRNTHTHRCNVAVGCISLRHVATPVKYNHNSIENFAILSS